VHLGKDLDKCMSKFDEEKLKIRRAFSLEQINEEDSSWVASGSEDGRDSPHLLDDSSEEDDEFSRPRRYSFPLSPKSRAAVPDPNFRQTVQEI
jgi:hypothetical protein